jgi:hypothetical protein
MIGSSVKIQSRPLDHDASLNVLYLLVLLILPVAALLQRFGKSARPQHLVAQFGDRTFEGEWWLDDNGIVCVRCPAGRGGRLAGPEGPRRTAEELLVDIYRDSGALNG